MKKYMSMQEELAARRAASENRDAASGQSTDTASGHFEQTRGAGGFEQRRGGFGQRRSGGFGQRGSGGRNNYGRPSGGNRQSQPGGSGIGGGSGIKGLQDLLSQIEGSKLLAQIRSAGLPAEPGSNGARGQNRTAGSGGRMLAAGRKVHFNSPEQNLQRSRLIKRILMPVVAAIVIVAIASVAAGYFAANDYDTGSTDPTEFTQSYDYTESTDYADGSDTTDSSQQQELIDSRQEKPAKGGDTGLHRNSSLVDVENYAAEHTEGLSDETVLFRDIYQEISTVIETKGSDTNWYVSEGRIYVWGKCDTGTDSEEVAAEWQELSDSIKSTLASEDLEETPVIIAVHDEDNYDLQVVLVDGEAVFVL